MLVFPNAKINIGLHVIRKRPDGYHDIATCLYPIPLWDALEGLPAEVNSFESAGNAGIPDDSNLVLKAYRLLAQDFPLPPLALYLLKSIPAGGGLGGGSSDAAFTIRLINELASLNLSRSKQEEYARQLGSDCAFFIENKPTFAYEKGDQFREIRLSLKGYTILLVNPGIEVSTADAYAGVKPTESSQDLYTSLGLPISQWRYSIDNDFEPHIFAKYPIVAQIKDALYEQGALYASMSGSGSTVYGIFPNRQFPDKKFRNCFVWQAELS